MLDRFRAGSDVRGISGALVFLVGGAYELD